MLADVQRYAANVWHMHQPEYRSGFGLLSVLSFSITIFWALWWLWRFVLSPRLFPLEVKEYPYWVPVLGHGFSFMNNSQKLFNQAREYFGNGAEPLQLTLFGLNVYFISRAEDISEAYRNTRTLTFDEFYRQVFVSMGTSSHGVSKLFASSSEQTKSTANDHQKSTAQVLRELQILQLQPGANLDALEMAELEYLDRQMQPDILRTSCCRYQPELKLRGATDQGDVIELSLLHWCTDIATRAAQKALFGSALDRIDSNLPDRFMEFDNLSWKMLYQFPGFLARDLLKKRDYLRSILQKFCDLPPNERDDAESWVIHSTEEKCRMLGLPSEDIASVLLILYWGTNTNTRKAAFWMICHLLGHPSLEAIRAETDPAFGSDGTIVNLGHLHTQCPQLDAAWNETMRLHGAAASIRTVTTDTVIGGRTLRAGRRLIIPYRQLHLEPTIFGEDVRVFRPDRFLTKKTESGERLRLEHFRPFGGGSTICSGRHFSKRIVTILVTLLIRRYDISTAGEQHSLPLEDEWRPVLGIVDPKPGYDMRIRLTPRKNMSKIHLS